jgi:tryptophan synthase alpha chain
VFLAAPSSTEQRIATITAVCRGFVYAASLMGVTGTRDAVGSQAEGLVQRIRPHTDLPVAVGLGVSNGAQAAQVAAFADGVIVGSAFVRCLVDAADAADAAGAAGAAAGTDAVAELAAELSAAVRRARP